MTGIAGANVTLAGTAPGVSTRPLQESDAHLTTHAQVTDLILAAGGAAAVSAYASSLKYIWIVGACSRVLITSALLLT